jgi:hypothetical protein
MCRALCWPRWCWLPWPPAQAHGPATPVAHRPRRGRHRGHHLCRDAADRPAHLLGRADRCADGAGALPVPAAAPAHHRSGPASRRQPARPPPLEAAAAGRGLYALRMDDELDFASASALERAITEHLAAHPDTCHVCLFAQPINRIDDRGGRLHAAARRPGRAWHHAAHQRHQAAGGTVLRRAGALDEAPLLRMYRTDADALQAFARCLGQRLPQIWRRPRREPQLGAAPAGRSSAYSSFSGPSAGRRSVRCKSCPGPPAAGASAGCAAT